MFKKYWFNLSVLICILFAFIFSDIGFLLYSKSSILVFIAIFITTIKLNIKDIKLNKITLISITSSNIITCFIAPILFYCIAYLSICVIDNQNIYIGFIILGVLPTTITSHIIFSSIAGGNFFVSTLNTITSNLLALFSIPFFLNIFLSEKITLNPLEIFQKMILIILLPTILAQIINYFLSEKIKLLKPFFLFLSKLIILAFIFTGIAINKNQLSNFSFEPITIFIIILFVILARFLILGVATLSTKITKLPRAEKISVIFSGSEKAVMVGLAITSDIFPTATQSTIIIVLFHIIQLSYDNYLAQKLSSTIQ